MKLAELLEFTNDTQIHEVLHIFYEMVGWHHRLNGHVSEQIMGDWEGQGSLACLGSMGSRETEPQQSRS